MCHFCYLHKILCSHCFTTYTKTQQNKEQKQKSANVYIAQVIGGVHWKSHKVNTFCRLGLFFAAGLKTNDIIEKQAHTRWFSFWLRFWTVQSTITWPVSSGCQMTCYTTGTINVPKHNFWIALAWGCLLWNSFISLATFLLGFVDKFQWRQRVQLALALMQTG